MTTPAYPTDPATGIPAFSAAHAAALRLLASSRERLATIPLDVLTHPDNEATTRLLCLTVSAIAPLVDALHSAAHDNGDRAAGFARDGRRAVQRANGIITAERDCARPGPHALIAQRCGQCEPATPAPPDGTGDDR